MGDEYNTNVPPDQRNAAPGKLPYVSPVLKKFGSVQLLTASSTGSGADGGTMAGKTATMTSDLQCKHNIVRIGQHPLGFGLYRFDYRPEFSARFGASRQFGVLAQEVEIRVPAAVHVGTDGFKRVNYSLLGIEIIQ